MIPALRRQGVLRLPRAERALAAWRKAAPPRQRTPLPWLAVSAMVCYVATVLQQPRIAAKWLVAFDTYLRPGELDALTIWQLVPPCGVSTLGTYGLWSILGHPAELKIPSKTNLFDEAVLIDDPLLAPLFEWLTNHRPLSQKVWDLEVHDEIMVFNNTACVHVATASGMPARHTTFCRGGAPHVIKARGRWEADSSARRYGKASLAMSELHRVPHAVECSELGRRHYL